MTTGFVAYDEVCEQLLWAERDRALFEAKYKEAVEVLSSLILAKANAGLNVNNTRRADFLKAEQAAWTAARAIVEGEE